MYEIGFLFGIFLVSLLFAVVQVALCKVANVIERDQQFKVLACNTVVLVFMSLALEALKSLS